MLPIDAWPQRDVHGNVALDRIPTSPVGPIGWPGHPPLAMAGSPSNWRRSLAQSGTASSDQPASPSPSPQSHGPSIGLFYSCPRLFSLNIPLRYLSTPNAPEGLLLNLFEGFHILRYQQGFTEHHWTLAQPVIPIWSSIYRRTPAGIDNLDILHSSRQRPDTERIWNLTFNPKDNTGEGEPNVGPISQLNLPDNCWVLSAVEVGFIWSEAIGEWEAGLKGIKGAWIKEGPSSYSPIFNPAIPQEFISYFPDEDLPPITIKPWMW